MDRDSLIAGLEGLISEYLKSRQVDLVELGHRYQGPDLVLMLLVDKPEGGITVGECASLNREIGGIIDAQNILGAGYILEVSSPGLDRPLRAGRDFARCLHKRVRVFLSAPVNGKLEWEGVIAKLENESVYLDLMGTLLEIPLANINKGKQVID